MKMEMLPDKLPPTYRHGMKVMFRLGREIRNPRELGFKKKHSDWTMACHKVTLWHKESAQTVSATWVYRSMEEVAAMIEMELGVPVVPAALRQLEVFVLVLPKNAEESLQINVTLARLAMAYGRQIEQKIPSCYANNKPYGYATTFLPRNRVPAAFKRYRFNSHTPTKIEIVALPGPGRGQLLISDHGDLLLELQEHLLALLTDLDATPLSRETQGCEYVDALSDPSRAAVTSTAATLRRFQEDAMRSALLDVSGRRRSKIAYVGANHLEGATGKTRIVNVLFQAFPDSVRTSEIAAQSGLSTKQVYRNIARLINAGVIERTGYAGMTRYRLVGVEYERQRDVFDAREVIAKRPGHGDDSDRGVNDVAKDLETPK